MSNVTFRAFVVSVTAFIGSFSACVIGDSAGDGQYGVAAFLALLVLLLIVCAWDMVITLTSMERRRADEQPKGTSK